MSPALLSRWLLVGFSIAAGSALATESPETTHAHTSKRHFDPICQIRLDPHDKFTRVAPDLLPAMRAEANLAMITVNYSGFTPQAQVAFQHAVNIWRNQLTSAVPTVVNANFLHWRSWYLLGQAGPQNAWSDFPGARRSATWFVDALANKLAGSDIGGPAAAEISAEFNSSANWYYGTDGLPPAGQIDFVSLSSTSSDTASGL